MKVLLTAIASLVLSSQLAIAADVAVEEAVVVPESFSWTGGYLGLSAGYGWGDSFVDFEGMDYNVDLEPKGFIGGAFAGYNYQFTNNVVFGVEGDAMYSDMDVSGVLGTFNGYPDPRSLYGVDIDWTASVRGRLGYAFDRFLPYVTAGVAFAHYDHSETQLAPASESATSTGWTVGAGVDYALTDNLFLKAEYRYSDYGSVDVDPAFWTAHSIDLDVSDVRIGIGYKF
jgi:outer membrane immunogenic protein